MSMSHSFCPPISDLCRAKGGSLSQRVAKPPIDHASKLFVAAGFKPAFGLSNRRNRHHAHMFTTGSASPGGRRVGLKPTPTSVVVRGVTKADWYDAVCLTAAALDILASSS